MTTTAETASDPKNDLVFLGINFNNFFKNCGCLNKRKDNDTISSASGKRAPQVERRKMQEIPAGQETTNIPNNEETHSVASSTDWADLEEINFPADPTLGAPLFESNDNAPLLEDFQTEEPIDFEHLKQLTGVKQEEDDAKSNRSGLSRSSKRIAKEGIQQPHMSRFAQKDQKDLMKGKRKPWQPHEDAKVLELVSRYGQSWAVVASMMEGRTGKQIRDRYLNKLRPNIKRGEWTNEEDRLLLSLYYQIGHKWSKIATYLPGRTEGQVKNRFYSHIKKKILSGDDMESPEANLNGVNNVPVMESYPMESYPMESYPMESCPMDSYQVYQSANNIMLESPVQDDYVKPLASPSGSTLTTASLGSRLASDRDVNVLLDRMVGYMDKKGQYEGGLDLNKLSMQDTASMSVESDPDNMSKLERLDELQKRRAKLEFLLQQTIQDMGTFNPQNMNIA